MRIFTLSDFSTRILIQKIVNKIVVSICCKSEHSIETCMEYNDDNAKTDHITLPYIVDDEFLKKVMGK